MQRDPGIEASLRMAELIQRHFSEGLDAGEQRELAAWLEADKRNKELFEQLSDEPQRQAWLQQLQAYDLEDGMQAIQRKISVRRFRYRRLLPYAAAGVVLAIAAGVAINRFYPANLKQPDVAASLPSGGDITAGGNKAMLTLANGHTIVLDSASSGLLTVQGTTKIMNAKSGLLTYSHDRRQEKPAPVSFNVLTTPNGGQYAVILPDNTKVWLNANSSIRYPTAFRADKREVELTGEAYFEVAHNDKQPFVVDVNGREIQDIGTTFNVKAYSGDGPMQTTLLQGAVKVIYDAQSILLRPGEQAQENAQGIIKVTRVNTDDAVAWKNGFFAFDNSDLKTVMRTLARWYDVKVAYDGKVPDEHFDGMIQRNLSLATVLKYLKRDGVDFEIEGRSITVSRFSR